MSQPNPINISFLHTFILQESENEAIQKLDPNFYESLSKYIGDLKNEEREGVEDKIKKRFAKYGNRYCITSSKITTGEGNFNRFRPINAA